jgi:hypothetical protein
MPTERHESFIPPLEDQEVQELARQGWILAAAEHLTLKQAEEYVASAKRLGFSVAQDSLPNGSFEAGTTDFFPRLRFLNMTKAPVNAADPNGLLQAIFQLSKTGDVAEKPITVNLPEGKGFLVVGLADFKAADQSAISGVLETSRQRARDSAAQNSLNLWVGDEVMRIKLRLPLEVQQDLDNKIQLN